MNEEILSLAIGYLFELKGEEFRVTMKKIEELSGTYLIQPPPSITGAERDDPVLYHNPTKGHNEYVAGQIKELKDYLTQLERFFKYVDKNYPNIQDNVQAWECYCLSGPVELGEYYMIKSLGNRLFHVISLELEDKNDD